jgi:DNA-binding NarL/FixJ family response regulator
VVGKATTTDEAIELAESQSPDGVVMELELPPGGIDDGIACLGELRERFPGVKVLVLAARGGTARVDAALDAGADAFIVKTAQADDVASLIFAAFEETNGKLRRRLSSQAADEETAVPASALTPRELEILRLVSEGHTNGAMARQLWVTEQTIKFHLSNIYRKLGVTNRTQASRWAQLHDFVPSTTSP